MKWKQIGLGWVGLDIYQPKKVEKYLKLNLMHSPNWGKIILYISCMHWISHNWWGAYIQY